MNNPKITLVVFILRCGHTKIMKYSRISSNQKSTYCVSCMRMSSVKKRDLHKLTLTVTLR